MKYTTIRELIIICIFHWKNEIKTGQKKRRISSYSHCIHFKGRIRDKSQVDITM